MGQGLVTDVSLQCECVPAWNFLGAHCAGLPPTHGRYKTASVNHCDSQCEIQREIPQAPHPASVQLWYVFKDIVDYLSEASTQMLVHTLH